jgi:hypothetical protein
MKTTNVEIMDTDVKNFISEQELEVQNIKKKIPNNGYELEVTLEDKVYPKTYYRYQPWSIVMNETIAKIKENEL